MTPVTPRPALGICLSQLDEVATAITLGVVAEIVEQFPIELEPIGTDTRGITYVAIGV